MEKCGQDYGAKAAGLHERDSLLIISLWAQRPFALGGASGRQEESLSYFCLFFVNVKLLETIKSHYLSRQVRDSHSGT